MKPQLPSAQNPATLCMSRRTSRKNLSKVDQQCSPKWGDCAWVSVMSILVFGVGIYRAIQLRWICDDAFITMRYVKNFVEGNGLVYNVGERVEGYTHFLWLLLLAAAKAIGLDPIDASIWLSIAAFGGVIFLLLTISYAEHGERRALIWLPVAAMLLALNYDATVWASGGLETSLYTFLILASFYVWFYTGLRERRRLLLTGVLLAFVALTRPDGVLFTATAVPLFLIRGIRIHDTSSKIARTLGTILLPSFAIGIPYLVWKYFYYGDLLPLTYYAKSGGEDYFSQGFFYIWLYFRVYFVSGIALFASILILLWKRVPSPSAKSEDRRGSASWTALAATVVYLIVFVARVGGDFMFARFMIPVVPFMCLLIEEGIEAFFTPYPMRRIGIVVLLLLATIFSDTIYPNSFFRINSLGEREENWNLVVVGNGTRHIADERWYYYNHFEHPEVLDGTMYINSVIGQFYQPIFAGLPVTVGIPGSMNMIAYYANFATAINEYGLTDSFIAHMPERDRGRIGHEKYAPVSYLRRRTVNFQLGSVVSKLPNQLAIDEIAIQIPSLGLWQLGKVLTYDRPLMDTLVVRFIAAGAQVRIPLYEMLIPDYLRLVLPTAPLSDLEADYEEFTSLYFSRYPDSSLQQPFLNQIAKLKEDSIAQSNLAGRESKRLNP